MAFGDLPDVRPGDRLSAAQENTMRQLVRTRQTTLTPGVVSDSTGQAAAPGIIRRARAAGSARQAFKIQSIANDWLVCRSWDGVSTGGFDVLVAKPFLLRHGLSYYPWLSSFTTVNTQEATVVEGGDTYTWKVTLPYAAGEVIWAERSSLADVMDGYDALLWEDQNVGAHAWGVPE